MAIKPDKTIFFLLLALFATGVVSVASGDTSRAAFSAQQVRQAEGLLDTLYQRYPKHNTAHKSHCESFKGGGVNIRGGHHAFSTLSVKIYDRGDNQTFTIFHPKGTELGFFGMDTVCTVTWDKSPDHPDNFLLLQALVQAGAHVPEITYDPQYSAKIAALSPGNAAASRTPANRSTTTRTAITQPTAPRKGTGRYARKKGSQARSPGTAQPSNPATPVANEPQTPVNAAPIGIADAQNTQLLNDSIVLVLNKSTQVDGLYKAMSEADGDQDTAGFTEIATNHKINAYFPYVQAIDDNHVKRLFLNNWLHSLIVDSMDLSALLADTDKERAHFARERQVYTQHLGVLKQLVLAESQYIPVTSDKHAKMEQWLNEARARTQQNLSELIVLGRKDNDTDYVKAVQAYSKSHDQYIDGLIKTRDLDLQFMALFYNYLHEAEIHSNDLFYAEAEADINTINQAIADTLARMDALDALFPDS